MQISRTFAAFALICAVVPAAFYFERFKLPARCASLIRAPFRKDTFLAHNSCIVGMRYAR